MLKQCKAKLKHDSSTVNLSITASSEDNASIFRSKGDNEMIYLVYKTDAWHTIGSRLLIACCDNKKKAIRLIKKLADSEDEKLSEDDIYNLEKINQTQGYKGNGEFVIDEVEKNVLIIW